MGLGHETLNWAFRTSRVPVLHVLRAVRTTIRRQRGQSAKDGTSTSKAKQVQKENEKPAGRTRGGGRVLRSTAKSSKADEVR